MHRPTTFMLFCAGALTAAAVAPSSSLCEPASTTPLVSPSSSSVVAADLADFIREFTTDRSGLQRFHNVSWCEERLDRMAAFVQEWRKKLAATRFDTLGQHGKVEYVLMRNELDDM